MIVPSEVAVVKPLLAPALVPVLVPVPVPVLVLVLVPVPVPVPVPVLVQVLVPFLLFVSISKLGLMPGRGGVIHATPLLLRRRAPARG